MNIKNPVCIPKSTMNKKTCERERVMSAAYGHATGHFLFSIHAGNAILSVVWPTHHKESGLCNQKSL
jgi:hypothetical protein